MMKWLLANQWDRWHQTKQLNPAPVVSKVPRQQANSVGVDGFDGLIERGVPFQYDAQRGCWFYYGKTMGA